MDPNERLPDPPTVYDDLTGLPPSVKLPEGVTATSKDWYVQKYTTRDGRTFYEFYRRGKPLPDGSAPSDPVVHTVQGATNTTQADRFKKEQDEAAKGAPTVNIGGVPHVVTGKDANGRDIYGPVQTASGAAASTSTAIPADAVPRVEGTPTGRTGPDGQPEYDNTKPIKVWRRPDGSQVKAETLDANERAAWERDKNPGGRTDAEARAQAEKDRPQLVPGTFGADYDDYAVLDPATGTLTWVPNDHKTPPTAPSTQRTINVRKNGEYTAIPNPNYIKPSKVQVDERTGEWIEVTVDDKGDTVIKPVTNQTTIKPADLPVLQAKYGQYAQSLGQMATDLNGRLARGEITEKQRNDAFTAAHKQAEVGVQEINTILENSRAVWSNELTARSQTFSEGASRRSFAGDVLTHAVGTGATIAASSGPGHGAAIAGGVSALLGLGQRYAEGMGGFPDMAAPTTPRALQQAREVGLPGFGEPSAGGAPAPAAAIPPVAIPPVALPSGADVAAQASSTMDASRSAFGSLGIGPGAAGPGAAPAAPSPVFRPPPPVGGGPLGGDDLHLPGQSPFENMPYRAGSSGGIESMPNPAGSSAVFEDMGNRLGAGAAGSPSGMPVAVGGGGLFDADAEAQNMIGDGSDPAWAAAVQRALEEQRGSRYRQAAIAGRGR